MNCTEVFTEGQCCPAFECIADILPLPESGAHTVDEFSTEVTPTTDAPLVSQDANTSVSEDTEIGTTVITTESKVTEPNAEDTTETIDITITDISESTEHTQEVTSIFESSQDVTDLFDTQDVTDLFEHHLCGDWI